MTEKNKQARARKSGQLLERFKDGKYRFIVFTDEKLFTVEQAFNRQNSRILAKSIEEVNKNGRQVSRDAHPLQVMIF
uniref:Uncharacterized protein n=1 Tax=Acrobeloides nanus TaxID=290746 RepID=A0A914E786_9BILA